MLTPQTFWCPRKIFGVPPENYSLRENIFQPPKTFGWSPKFFVFQARIFWFLPFWECRLCLDYVIDPLLATSAL